MTDVFGLSDVSAEDTSSLKTGNLRRSYNEKLESCVKQLKAKGHSMKSAQAICRSSIRKKKK